ncbi:hypothetical protein RR46_13551 [Papilio xuthus]|uniref:Uncharacterized protein n=1 Tax=Papilio xuthus TaxID=66420 RepID=A0A194PMI8_PAPXU|nr:hypothetical protein RR46_13551 [Papilio xuthus]
MEKSSRLKARGVPLSAIAWPYRWLFALTECGEQRSPRACVRRRTARRGCVRRRTARVPTLTARAHTAPCTLYGCVPKPLSILSMRRRRIATYSGHARGEEFRGGGRIVNCYEVDFGPEIPK